MFELIDKDKSGVVSFQKWQWQFWELHFWGILEGGVRGGFRWPCPWLPAAWVTLPNLYDAAWVTSPILGVKNPRLDSFKISKSQVANIAVTPIFPARVPYDTIFNGTFLLEKYREKGAKPPFFRGFVGGTQAGYAGVDALAAFGIVRFGRLDYSCCFNDERTRGSRPFWAKYLNQGPKMFERHQLKLTRQICTLTWWFSKFEMSSFLENLGFRFQVFHRIVGII